MRFKDYLKQNKTPTSGVFVHFEASWSAADPSDITRSKNFSEDFTAYVQRKSIADAAEFLLKFKQSEFHAENNWLANLAEITIREKYVLSDYEAHSIDAKFLSAEYANGPYVPDIKFTNERWNSQVEHG